MLDDYVITEDLHSDRLCNRHFSIPKLLILLDDCKSRQGALVQITGFCQYICTGALEIEPFFVEGNVMRVTRRHTLVMLYGVAAVNSVQKLTRLPLRTLILLARNGPRLSTDTFLFTLRVRVEYVSFPVVTTLVGASAVFHRHAGIPA